MSEPPATVRPAGHVDVSALAAALASAFLDDPVFAWLLPDSRTREARVGRLFATVLRNGAIRRHAVEVALAKGRVVGGAIWFPPGRWQPTLLEQLGALPGYARALGRRLGPATSLLQALARDHPRDPHWYLYAIGVEPRSQGHGVGGALLRSRLVRGDEVGLPAYLESTTLAGVPLYKRFGFRVTGTPALPRGAPVVTAMWRDAEGTSRPA